MGKSELQDQLDRATATLNWCLKSEDARRINAMLDMARSEPGIPILPDQMDRDPWLFNCANGTLELKTGRLREHRREDYITKLCPVEYHPEARCPVWNLVLEMVFAQKQSIISYLQRVLGHCLTGDTSEQALWIFWGSGSNGKSIIINTILELLGEDYAVKAARDLFLARKTDNHPTQVARLFGRRLVVCTETGSGARLDEVLVKELTGGDPVTARRMREDPWQFVPAFKPVLVTNHKPEVRDTDDGIWRRCRLIPFEVRFWDPARGEAGAPELKADKTLPQKLRAEYPGILSWLLKGCLDWQRDGLQTPQEVLTATGAYRGEQDVMGQFLAECCVKGSVDYKAKAGDLYGVFLLWCDENHEVKISQRRFGQALTERGFERYTDNGTKYRGVAVNKEWCEKYESPWSLKATGEQGHGRKRNL
jgi:putative DNA primase/helicase